MYDAVHMALLISQGIPPYMHAYYAVSHRLMSSRSHLEVAQPETHIHGVYAYWADRVMSSRNHLEVAPG